MRDQFGGYCYLNNAAVAAQRLRSRGAGRVAILDVDYHHGNGTQDIFYDRDDVLYCSIHCDPLAEFPFFFGHAEETGTGEGTGRNFNLPLPRGTRADAWFEALEHALEWIESSGCDHLVVSLGVDTFEADPISHFRLGRDAFAPMGERIAQLGLPTVFVLEGGYASDELGDNVVSVLTGFGSA
jgi:acetoin utilization deacetylase AcuC-like enzyme